MNLVPYTYQLPDELIAQRPVRPYDTAVLLVVDRATGTIEETTFAEFHKYLSSKDLLVFNDTRVVPARHRFDAERTGFKGEVLLLEEMEPLLWRCLARPLRRLRIGREVVLTCGASGVVDSRVAAQEILVRFRAEGSSGISTLGLMPIPPYIRGGEGDADDVVDYQPLLAANDGSVAAPTASLHFTAPLFDRIRETGCSVGTVTLHLGTASFLPVLQDDGSLRQPGRELLTVPKSTIEQADKVRAAGAGRVIAVGTTVVRALESAKLVGEQKLDATELFITPGFEFRGVDCIVTNFHQPGTTHLLLVEAFLGRELLEKVYRFALARRLRFLSYGDGMLLV